MTCCPIAGCDFADAEIGEKMSNSVHGEAYAIQTREDAAKRSVRIDKKIHKFRRQSEFLQQEHSDKARQAEENSTYRG